MGKEYETKCKPQECNFQYNFDMHCYICQTCGYVLTKKDIQFALHQANELHQNENNKIL